MQVLSFLRRWVDTLAMVLLAWRETWRARRPLVVSPQAKGFTVSHLHGERQSVIGTVSPGTRPPGRVMRAARESSVILELPAETVVVRRMSVPAQAREFLSGIVRNQIERVSPWQASQAMYGFDAVPSQDDPKTLDLRILVTSRAVVDAARSELAAAGLTADRIVARERDAETSTPVTLWSRFADASSEELAGTRQFIVRRIAIAVGASVFVSVWAMASASSIYSETDDIDTRARDLQRQIQAARSPQALNAHNPMERAWLLKEASPSAVVALEALSRALPDTAYLTELHLESTTMRIMGLSADVPSLLAPLERSGYLTEVHFFAPTIRGPDGNLFRFNIEARVKAAADFTME